MSLEIADDNNRIAYGEVVIAEPWRVKSILIDETERDYAESLVLFCWKKDRKDKAFGFSFSVNYYYVMCHHLEILFFFFVGR